MTRFFAAKYRKIDSRCTIINKTLVDIFEHSNLLSFRYDDYDLDVVITQII